MALHTGKSFMHEHVAEPGRFIGWCIRVADNTRQASAMDKAGDRVSIGDYFVVFSIGSGLIAVIPCGSRQRDHRHRVAVVNEMETHRGKIVDAAEGGGIERPSERSKI